MATKSKERYYAGQTQRLAINRARKLKRHARRMLSKPADPRRGHTRMKRRQDMDRFNRDRIARLMQPTGTIQVHSPSLQMLGKFIGRVGT